MPSHRQRILTMNRGSATLKSTLYEVGARDEALLAISVTYTAAASAHLKIADAKGTSLLDTSVKGSDSNAALEAIFAWLDQHEYLFGLAAAGHRLVHGGSRYHEPQRITPKFLSALEKLIPLDPDHLPAAIRGIRFVAKKFPKLPQVACFDTAFHSSLPTVAKMYALPRRFYDQGIRRYGFHGLSFEYIVGELRKLDSKLAAGRVIIAHLGSGASIVALQNGKSMDTSMGFTPLEGLVMGTRSGTVDPGLVLWLIEHAKIAPDELTDVLEKRSGLVGLAGTPDMREVLARVSQGDAGAELALAAYLHRLRGLIGSMAAALGGLDTLVFTGGVGENSAEIRAQAAAGLGFLGVALDEQRNAAARGDTDITAPGAVVRGFVVAAREDIEIARQVREVLRR